MKKIIQSLKNTKNSIRDFLFRSDFIYFYVHRFSDKKKFKEIVEKNINNAFECLLDGVGGAKNILNIKNSINSVNIEFKSRYLLDKELLEKSGGLGLTIMDHNLLITFDYMEAKSIAKKLQSSFSDYKATRIPIDID